MAGSLTIQWPAQPSSVTSAFAPGAGITIAAPQDGRQNSTLPWYGSEYSMDDFIVYSFYGHKREHSAQIDHFRNTLKGQT